MAPTTYSYGSLAAAYTPTSGYVAPSTYSYGSTNPPVYGGSAVYYVPPTYNQYYTGYGNNNYYGNSNGNS